MSKSVVLIGEVIKSIITLYIIILTIPIENISLLNLIIDETIKRVNQKDKE